MAILMLFIFIIFPVILIVLSMLVKRYRYLVFLLAFMLPVTLVVWGSNLESILGNLDAIALYTSAYCLICGVTMFISAKVRKSTY